MRTSYYALTLDAFGTSTPAFYSVSPTSNLQILEGAVTTAPIPATYERTTVNMYPQTLQIGAPASLISAGVTIVTDAANMRVGP